MQSLASRFLGQAVFIIVLFTMLAMSLPAQSGKPSVASVLAPDGTILSTVSGNFDPAGYRMSYGLNGEPRFLADNAGGCVPDRWDTAFTTNGANNDVDVIVSDGNGNLYVGGSFTSIQGNPIKGIAKWDGMQWSGFGNGINGTVKAIAFLGTDIYIGGNFWVTAGNPANHVAKWNGTAWSGLGAGLGTGHQVEDVVVVGSDVYIGGSFNLQDGSPANGLVRWDGSALTAVGPGINGQVYDLAVKDGHLYAGGFITVAGNTSIAGLMKWDGVSWSGFGLSSNTTVDAIGFNGTDIWVGGLIRRTGSNDTHVARWNGASWTSLGFFSESPYIHAFAFVGTDVYAGGTFERFNGVLSDGIVKYNGSQWTEVGTGTQLGSAEVHTLYVSGNTIYIGGDFQLAGGVGARNIATLTNGTIWDAPFPGNGLDNPPSAIAVSGSDVYVGGNFISAGPVTANRIAKWNSLTNTWSSLAGGISGFNTEFSSVSAIAVAGGKVYAGGSFSRIGGIAAANIAVWNGTAWSPLGTGITGGNARVYSITVRGDEVIVAGDFTTAGGVPANRIAKWNGTAWSALPGNPPIPSPVIGVGFVGNDIYVASASTAVDNPNYLLKFDGTTWTGLSPGMGGHGFTSLAVIGTDVYVSGGFAAIAGVPATRVAKWNGASWSALGNGLPSPFGSSGVYLGAAGGDLIAIGDFTTASGGPTNYIARWNGTAWSALGNGINASGTRVVSGGGDVFISGAFTTAGCNTSPYFARWRELVWTGTAGTDWHATGNWSSGSVPPATAGVTIAATDVSIISADVTVNNLIITNNRTMSIASGRTLTVTGTLDLTSGSIAGSGSLIVNGDLRLAAGSITGLSSISVNGNLYLNGMISGTGTVSLTTCRASALSGGGPTAFITSPFTRCVAPSGSYLFPVGTGAVYSPVSLANVTGTSSFTIEAKSGAYSGPAAGLPANRLQRWWQLTNGGITQADITFNYLDSEVVGLEQAYRVYRINGGTAEQQAAVFNTTNNTATVAGVTSFSPWTLAEVPASAVSVGGKVRRPDGRPIPFITVTLTDGLGGVWTAVTKHSGLYRFDNVVAPRQYTLTVTPRKTAIFAAPQQVRTVSDNVTNADFVTSRP